MGAKFVATDERGAEMTVEVGSGVPAVEHLNESNHKITMKVAGLKFPVYGFLGGSSPALVQVLEDAAAAGREVEYRIETRRKNGVEVDIPFAELDHKSQCVRLFTCADGVWSTEVAPTAGATGAVHSAVTAKVADEVLLERLREFVALTPRKAALDAAIGTLVATSTIPVATILAVAESGTVHTTEPTVSSEPVKSGKQRVQDTVEEMVATARATDRTPAVDPSVAGEEDLARLAVLMRMAGVTRVDLATYLIATFGIDDPALMGAEDLAGLLARYRAMGSDAGPSAFADDVHLASQEPIAS